MKELTYEGNKAYLELMDKLAILKQEGYINEADSKSITNELENALDMNGVDRSKI